MTPRRMAVAALIHHECSIRGWDRTSGEVALALCEHYPSAREWSVTARHVAGVAREKGWSARLRGAATGKNEGVPASVRLDQELAALDGGRGFDPLEFAA
ncbi:hypothetical protein PANO111632_02795 [Paracoccus nototheniae]|uniref:Uncharacterized protein n=1 Tax=Paracoccus nototheniae TaxID=2489002 RepID=A0ABW4DX95_9RHOB|nr:hypothetical protein [Paracoccus nototheniae]